MIEAEVHQRLRAFLKEQGEPYWPHHLTMARLVARAFRLGRSALIQAGSSSVYHGRHRLSYLMPSLLWSGPAVLVLPEAIQQRILLVEIPRLRQWMPTIKSIQVGDRWPNENYQGLLITSPEAWLSDRLGAQTCFPSHIPTLIDGADDLESWVRHQLTVNISSLDWDSLMLAYPACQDIIRDIRVQLTYAVFRHPENPYSCYLLDELDHRSLSRLNQVLRQTLAVEQMPPVMPPSWQAFWQQYWQPHRLIWTTINRQQGQFWIHCGPAEISSSLAKVWAQQPVVLMGAALDLETQASTYRQRLGLDDLTCLKFSPDRQQELIQLYLPDHLPLPNTREFQSTLLQEIRLLLASTAVSSGLSVILVSDMPLQHQLGTHLAAEFGSRVQVEKTCLDENGILVTNWQFWRIHQHLIPTPQMLVITTLPIPSLENPAVANRVAFYKQQRQDWFRLYLLPEALSELQRAIAPIRERQGIVALLDNRVNYRSYGQQVMAALSPAARTNYIDVRWLNNNCSILD